ncbi:carboxylesterase/lipase family protein [Pseudarthrobacter sp. NKDBFgelt]|uniref:carboxylesterase/lipase family protein n=1 Tax=Pseudarthrobacter sp. NKDBFgelt TaxID=3384443 RepID=UPI0038D4E2BC
MTDAKPPSGAVRGTTVSVEGTPVHRFLGIPYAEPPSGSRRFRPPAPAARRQEVRDCTTQGPAAPQNPESHAPPGTEPRTWSEHDCLNLNIWTPAVEDGARPVMVWVHGGAYLSGSNSDAMYDGGSLAAASGTVVVTVNYRLGALGFLHLAEVLGAGYEDSSNLGLLDLLEALRWIQGNIGAFGGDPGNVTLFGESAGAAAVGTLLGMPSSSGLFRRAIMQSGTAERYRSQLESTRICEEFLALCSLDRARAREVLTLPVERILTAQEELVRRAGEATFAVPLPFQPTVGTPSLPLPPLDAVRGGLNTGVDLLLGTNLNEGSFAVEMRPGTAADPDYPDRAAAVLSGAGVPRAAASGYAEALTRLLGREPAGKELLEAAIADSVYRQPSNRLLDARSGAAGRTFSYLFTWRSPAMGGKLGACHALEIPFVFRHADSPQAAFLTRGKAPTSISNAMSGAWAAFAQAGTPRMPGLEWPEYEPQRATMILDETPRVDADPRRELREFFDAVRLRPAS